MEPKEWQANQVSNEMGKYHVFNVYHYGGLFGQYAGDCEQTAIEKAESDYYPTNDPRRLEPEDSGGMVTSTPITS